MRLAYWAALTFVAATPLYPWGTVAWLAVWACVAFSRTSKPRKPGAPRTEGQETSDGSWQP